MVTDSKTLRNRWITGQLTAKIISADGTLVFEGDVNMFRNCFFDNAELADVLNWAVLKDFTVKII